MSYVGRLLLGPGGVGWGPASSDVFFKGELIARTHVEGMLDRAEC